MTFVRGCLPRRLGKGFDGSSVGCVISLVCRFCRSGNFLSRGSSSGTRVSVSRSRLVKFIMGGTRGSNMNGFSPRSVAFVMRKRLRCYSSVGVFSW